MSTYKEIRSIAELETHVSTRGSLQCVVCQQLDLREHASLMRSISARDATFLGCEFDADTLQHVIATGGLIFPPLRGVPYQPYRSSLYSISELFEGHAPGQGTSFFEDAHDSEIYRHFMRFRSRATPPPILETMSQRLHDHAIDEALSDLLEAHPNVVAIMGGHKMKRDQPDYRNVALVARGLTRAGYFVATGGGPGAMEAGNLGAYLAPFDDHVLDDVIDRLQVETDYKKDAYLNAGLEILDTYPDGAESLAIPTWFYGHEPTNTFATHIAKYFSNSIREDTLLAIATSGVIFSPGSAGTIQEVFMDAAQNHYGSFKVVSPMVFFGTAFWTQVSPVYPLLKQLAASRQYGKLLTILDDPEAIISFIQSNQPIAYKSDFRPDQ